MVDCTILILTYKGKHHLEHLLPTVDEAIKNTPDYKIDVLIVDNGYDKLTREFVENNFPHFGFDFSPQNNYLYSLNPYVRIMDSEFVFILNDDMRLDIDILNIIIPVIKNDDKIFSVSCNVKDWMGEFSTAYPRVMQYSRAWLSSKWAEDNIQNELKYTLYGGGGAAIFRTKMFNELRGFCTLYRPAYCEDLDLGHRAWQNGWQNVYHPDAIIYHREGATIHNQFGDRELKLKIYKNQILWMVRNANISGFLIKFILLIPIRIISLLFVDKDTHLAFIKALRDIPKAIKYRLKYKTGIISDHDFIDKLNSEYTAPDKYVDKE